MLQSSYEQKILTVTDQGIKETPDAVDDYFGGNKKAIGFLMGQIMKRTKGQANPKLATELLKKKLDQLER